MNSAKFHGTYSKAILSKLETQAYKELELNERTVYNNYEKDPSPSFKILYFT